MENQLTLPLLTEEQKSACSTQASQRLQLIRERHAALIAQCATQKATTDWELDAFREVRDALIDHEVEVMYAERNDRKNELRAAFIESKFVLDPVSGCRVWTGATSHGKGSPESFGIVYWTRKSIPAHTVVFTIRGNRVPYGHVVAHKCGNLLCGEQSHLYLKPSLVSNYKRTPVDE